MILLIQPLGSKYDFLTIRMPNGLLSVAAPLVRDGRDVIIIDQKIDHDWKKKIEDYLIHGVTCVGITCSTGSMISHAIAVSRFVKGISSEIPVVWGGPHPSLLPEQTLLSCKYIDIVVVNEGDETFYELVKALEKKCGLQKIKGIYYKGHDGDICKTKPGELIQDIDKLEPLPYHLIEIERYSSIQTTDKKTRSIDLISSRGCPFTCGFCSVPLIPGRKWRAKSAGKMIEEIKHLKENYGVEEFYYVDDNFMVDLNRVEQFADMLIRDKLNILWGLQGVRVESVMKMNSLLLDKLEKAGLTELSIGVESGNPRILEIIDKGIKVEYVHKINRILKERPFQIKYNFIIGFPSETYEEVKKSVHLALQLAGENNKVWFPFNIFTPFPGTEMFDMAVRYGFQPPSSLEEWSEIESTGTKSRFRRYIDEELYQFLININAASYLAFPAAKTKITNRLYRFLFSLYYPLAHWRFSRHQYKWFFERHIMKFIIG